MKHYSWMAVSALMLGFMMLNLTSCSKDEEDGVAAQTEKENGGKDDDGNKDSGKDDEQPTPSSATDILVTVDANGQADGGHDFQLIDESNFYVDGIKYSIEDDHLVVSGYDRNKLKRPVVIISALNYQGRTMSVTSIGGGAFSYATIISSVTIPNSVTSIGNSAFSGCNSLTSITIPNSVTSIGTVAFAGSRLTSVTIPSSVTSIGLRAFGSCYYLESMVVDEGNDYYDSRENCNAIIETVTNTLISACKNTTIPSSVMTIGEEAFRDSHYGRTSVDIPYGVTSIGRSAFADNNMTSVTIPSSVTSIGFKAFANCYSLKSVTIPKNVTSIAGRMFEHCLNMTSVTIPEGVTSIEVGVFSDCPKLKDIYCHAVNPPSASSAFGTYSATLHVPAASVETYSVRSPWSNFGSIVAL